MKRILRISRSSVFNIHSVFRGSACNLPTGAAYTAQRLSGARRARSSGPETTEPILVVNPATEEIIGQVNSDTVETVQDKVEQAEAGQVSWESTPLAERKRIIGRFKELLRVNAGKLSGILVAEIGKPTTHANGEIKATQARVQYFLDNVDQVLKDQKVGEVEGGKLQEYISHEPLGVIANISAWNYPYFVGTNVIIPALLTGNAVLYKPSEYATLTGLHITDTLHEAGVPSNVLIPVLGKGSVGQTLIQQPQVNGVFFTGSNASGQKVANVAGPRMVRMQLELGGKDPAYVNNDLNGDQLRGAAASLAEGAFYNCGQSCCAVERIYVHEDVYDEFVQHFVSAVKEFKVGDPALPSTFIGPLTRPGQIPILERQVAEAVAWGATVVHGSGKRLPYAKGFYFDPTVVADCTNSMTLMREESFGPVIGIGRVETIDEAVALMNDTDYGLTASVYSASSDQAQYVLKQMNSGTVYWNCCDRVVPRLPWSGRKGSGIGTTLSIEGIKTFTQTKAWHARSL